MEVIKIYCQPDKNRGESGIITDKICVKNENS